MSPEPGRGRHLGAKAPPEGLVDGGLGAVAPAHEEAVGAPEPHEVCKAKKREGPEGDGPHKGRMGLCRDVHHCSIPWTVSLCLCLYQGSLLLCAHLGLYCWYPSSQPHNQATGRIRSNPGVPLIGQKSIKLGPLELKLLLYRAG